MILLCSGVTIAADWTVSGNDSWTPALPGTAKASESTHTNSAGNSITIKNVKTQKNGSYTAFFLTKNSGYVTLQQFDKPVAKIVLWGMNGAAKGAVVNITDGSTSLGTIALNNVGATNSFPLEIPAAKQSANPTIKIAATSAANVQISKIEIFFADSSAPALSAPAITLNDAAKNFTISSVTGGTVYYCVNSSATATKADCTTAYTEAVPYKAEAGTFYVHAYAKATDTENFLDSDLATVSYTVVDPSKQKVYSLVTDPSKLAVGDCFIVVYQSEATYKALGKANENNFGNVDVADMVSGSGDNRVITIPADATVVPTDITVAANTSSTSSDYPFLFKIANGYLHSVNGNNYLRASETVNESSPFAIANSNGKATIKNQAVSGNSSEIRYLRFNNSNKIFSCYKSSSSGMQDCYIYALEQNREPEAYTLPQGNMELTVGDTKAIDLGQRHPEVSVTSGNEAVATVSNGTVTAVGEGEATITVNWTSDDNWTNEGPATFTVKVSKKVYNPGFASSLNMRVGDTTALSLGTEHPEVSFTVSGDAVTVSEQGVITAVSAGDATVTATWGDNAYADGSATIDVTVKAALQDPGLGFLHHTVYGKLGVGVAWLAAYHDSPAAITYTSSDPTVVEVDAATGQIRPGQIHKVGTATIKASIVANDDYKAGEATYTVIIRTPDQPSTNPGETSTVTFDFVKENAYGMYTYTIDNCQDDNYGYPIQLFETDRPSGTEVSSITEGDVKLELGGNYRHFKSSADNDYFLDIEDEAILVLTVPTGKKITKISISGKANQMYCFNDENGNTVPWTDGNTIEFAEGVEEYWLVGKNGNDPEIPRLVIELTGESQAAAIAPDLKFEKKVYSFYDGEDTEINKAVSDHIGLTITYDIITKTENGTPVAYTIDDSGENLKVNVTTTGVYTLRAISAQTEEYLEGKAIARLNVYPKPQVNAPDDEEPENTEYALLGENGGAVNFGETPSTVTVVYTLNDGTDEIVHDGNDLTFTEDTKITYWLRYGGVADEGYDSPVQIMPVVVRPQMTSVDRDGTMVSFTSPQGHDVYYRFVNGSSVSAAPASNHNGWTKAEGSAYKFDPSTLADGEQAIIQTKSVKYSDLISSDVDSNINQTSVSSDGTVTAIDIIETDNSAAGVTVEGIYNLNGMKMNMRGATPGIYIVRYSDGTTAKIIIRK